MDGVRALLPVLLLRVTQVVHAAFLPSGLPWGATESPALWLGLDASLPDPASEQPVSPRTRMAATLARWLSEPADTRRPWPTEGLRLGVVALQPDPSGQTAPRVVHPPVPLDVPRPWPEQADQRRLALAGRYQLLDATGQPVVWGQDWQPGQSLLIDMPWLPPTQRLPEAGDALTLRLNLPARLPTSARPRLRLANASAPAGPDSFAAEPGLLPDDGTGLVLDLADWWQRWRAEQGRSAVPGRWWRLQVLPAVDEVPAGGWQAPEAARMPELHLTWRWPSQTLTGRDRLLQILPTLLPDEALGDASDPVALLTALRTLQQGLPVPAASPDWPLHVALPGACGHTGALMLQTRPAAADQPALQAAVAQPSRVPVNAVQGLVMRASPQPWPGEQSWQQAAAEQWPSLLTRWVDRQLAPDQPWHMAEIQPLSSARSTLLLARVSRVPGRSRHHAVQGWQPCPPGAPCPQSASWQVPLPGQDVLPTSPRWLSDAGQPPGGLLTDAAGDVPLPDGLFLASGPDRVLPAISPASDPATTTHRLRLGQDGVTSLWRASGEAAWLWLPVALHGFHAQQRQDLPRAGEPEAWSSWQVMTRHDSTGASTTHAFATQGGVILALHWRDPEQPRLGWSPGVEADGPVRHLTLITIPGDDGPRPWLLASHDSGAVTLRDGLNGQVRWRALSEPMVTPWQVLMPDAFSLLAYAPARSGRIWRLRGRPGDPDSLFLRQVAALQPAPETASDWLEDVQMSVAWQRLGGQRLPRLALVASRLSTGSTAGEGIWAWHERSDETGNLLIGDSLPHWSPDQPLAPVTDIGWRRSWTVPGTRVTSPPGWLQGALVVTTASPQRAGSDCAPPAWTQQAHHLPWGAGLSGAAAMTEATIKTITAGDSASANGLAAALSPQLSADGTLVWQGEAGTHVIRLALPTAWRQRIGREPLPRQP